jgi:hypothetical protein
MRKVIGSLCLAAFFLFKTQAQSVEYTTKNYTKQLSPLKLSVIGLSLDNFRPQFGLLAQGASGKLGYTVMFRTDFFKNAFIPKTGVVNVENLKPAWYAEATADYFFVDDVKENEGKLRLDVEGTGGKKYYYADCDIRKQIGFHAGLQNYSLTTISKNDPEATHNWVTKSGTPPSNSSIFLFNSNSTGLIAGLVFKKVRKATVNSDGWNNFRHLGRRIFLDLIVGGTSYETISSGGSTYTVKSKQPSPIGYRVGFEWDQMGVVTRFEIGQRPQRFALGLPGYNYINLSFSFNFYHSDKTYAMSAKYQK